MHTHIYGKNVVLYEM